MHDPTSRASNLRTTALASAVALVLALPLAFASAGPSGPQPAGHTQAGHQERHDPQGRQEPAEPPVPLEPAQGPPGGSGGVPPGPQAPAGAFCGPELHSPEGVEAQTCVLTEGPDTWGRVYYRNATGEPLLSALTLLRPDGRTVQVHCQVPATDEPGLCETPREPTVPEDGDDREPYAAVAELADAAGERLLLRAGSTRA